VTEPSSQSGSGDEPALISVRSHFVRHRNALAVQADFSPVFVDYFLHLMEHGLKNEPAHDVLMKDALATVVLHATTRPWKETHAWTLHFADAGLNLFVTAGSLLESVVGRVFTEGVRESDRDLFYAQVHVTGEEPRQSAVEIAGDDLFAAVETFYRQSEQRTARLFHLREEEMMMISAQPDCDEDWLRALDSDGARSLHEDEETTLLETRRFRFHCGCSLERIYPALAPLAAEGLDSLFLGDQVISVQCPRCAAKWRVSREQMEALVAERSDS